eukprot:359937-Chlamydomonas_euryale.AAC.22
MSYQDFGEERQRILGRLWINHATKLHALSPPCNATPAADGCTQHDCGARLYCMRPYTHATPATQVYIPAPTWSNHFNIWKDAGVESTTHRYYDPVTRGLDLEGVNP